MCLAIPAEVVSVGDGASDLATVDMIGVRREINIGMLDDVVPGDWVLVHVGFALSKIDEAEARMTMTMLEGITSGGA